MNREKKDEINQAAGIALDGSGNFMMASSKGDRLLVFFNNGKPMCHVDVTGLTHSAKTGNIVRPADLRLMIDGSKKALFVVSVTRQEVYKFYITED